MQGQGAVTPGELPFGLAAVTTSHPIAVGLVDWSPTRATFVVKIALQQDGEGQLSVARLAAPLHLDTFDEQGNLIFATDFAPYKPACDVFVVEEADGRGAAGRLAVDPIDLQVSRGETLGPRESTFDSGNPMGARDAWTQRSFDFSSFQSSPPTRRLAWPRTGFDVHLDRGDLRFHARFVEPFPAAVVVAPDGARVLARPALVLDTIAIDARAAELVLCFRGIVDDTAGALRGATLQIELRDAAGQALAAAAPRSVAVRRPDDVALASPATPLVDDTTTTTQGFRFAVEQTQIAPMARPAGRPLPFPGADRRPLGDENPRPAQSLAALRAETAQPVAPAWEAAEGTVALRRSPAADLIVNHETTPLPPSRRWDVPAPVTPPPSTSTSTSTSKSEPEPEPEPEPDLPTPPQPRVVVSDEPSTTVDDGAESRMTDEPSTLADDGAGARRAKVDAEDAALIRDVQREIWKGERSLAEILASHGLSEESWRAMKRPPRRT